MSWKGVGEVDGRRSSRSTWSGVRVESTSRMVKSGELPVGWPGEGVIRSIALRSAIGEGVGKSRLDDAIRNFVKFAGRNGSEGYFDCIVCTYSCCLGSLLLRHLTLRTV